MAAQLDSAFRLPGPQPSAVVAADSLAPAPAPALDASAWVLVEVWPPVRAVTLTAYFLDSNSRKNQALCATTKAAFDRVQVAQQHAGGPPQTSYRLCMIVAQARAEGYLR